MLLSLSSIDTTLEKQVRLTRRSGRARWPVLGAAAWLSLIGLLVMAHEGHAPLPSKGVDVDVEKGTIVLTKSAREALGIQTAAVEKRVREERLLAYSRIVAPWGHSALVSSQVSGKIVQLHVEPGAWVAAGEPLADLASGELENLQHELLQARIAHELSGKLVEHYRMLATESVNARQAQDAGAKHAQNRYSLEIARAKLKNLGLSENAIQQLESHGESELSHVLTLRSPIAGRVHHLALSVGKFIQPSEPLFEVLDVSRVWAQIDVLEKDLRRLEPGYSVEVRLAADSQTTHQGKLAVIEQYLDPKTHLGRAWVDLENPDPQHPTLLPGMFGQAQIVIPSNETLMTVPAQAVARDGAERFVLLQNEETAKASVYSKQNIVVIHQGADRVQFRSPNVFAKDVVVTTGAHELFNFFIQSVLKLSPEARQNIGLQTYQVTDQRIDRLLNLPGQIELPAENRDQLSVTLPGRIQRILVERGARVAAGDVLVELESLEFQDLQLQLLAASIEAENHQVALERLKKAAQEQSVAQRQLWETESQLLTLQNRIENLRHRLETAGLAEKQLDDLLQRRQLLATLPVRATIAGAVVGLDKALGQSVDVGQTIVELHDNSRFWVRGFLTERESADVQVGQTARIRIPGDPVFMATAKVVRRDQALDPASRTLSVWLELDQPTERALQDNLLVDISLILDTASPGLAVPQEALVKEGTQRYVFVRLADGRFQRRNVKTGPFDERFVSILEGLQAGEEIASWGAVELQTAYNTLR